MRKKRENYSRLFKLKVIEDVLGGGLSKNEAQRKYGLTGKSQVLKWMRDFGLASFKTLPPNFEAMKSKKPPETAALYERIRQLEKQLKDAELKAEIYSKMIDIAEQQLNIPIRKKPFTRQPEK